jgi:hypothetical protein
VLHLSDTTWLTGYQQAELPFAIVIRAPLLQLDDPTSSQYRFFSPTIVGLLWKILCIEIG